MFFILVIKKIFFSYFAAVTERKMTTVQEYNTIFMANLTLSYRN
jgi:hypothetical protein